VCHCPMCCSCHSQPVDCQCFSFGNGILWKLSLNAHHIVLMLPTHPICQSCYPLQEADAVFEFLLLITPWCVAKAPSSWPSISLHHQGCPPELQLLKSSISSTMQPSLSSSGGPPERPTLKPSAEPYPISSVELLYAQSLAEGVWTIVIKAQPGRKVLSWSKRSQISVAFEGKSAAWAGWQVRIMNNDQKCFLMQHHGQLRFESCCQQVKRFHLASKMLYKKITMKNLGLAL